MFRHILFSTAILALVLVSTTAVNAYGPGYYNHVARHAYFNSYGPGYYTGYGNGAYSAYGYSPYGYGTQSTYLSPYDNSYFPANGGYGANYNGYGDQNYYGSPYSSGYNAYGFGPYSEFRNGL